MRMLITYLILFLLVPLGGQLDVLFFGHNFLWFQGIFFQSIIE